MRAMLTLWAVLGPALVAADAWQPPRAPSGHVNDYAEMLSRPTTDALEQRLTAYEQETSNQIVIVTVPSLDGRDIEDVAFDIGTRWGIGKHGRDNGVLFVIARQERRTRIEVGKGLEGALTDVQAHVILDEIVKPAFAARDFDRGVREGAQAIMNDARGEFLPAPDGIAPVWSIGFALLLLILFLFFPRAGMLLLFMAGRRGGRRFEGGGGRFGGGGASGSW